jgi:acyl transferase domain-containing protein
MSTSSEGQRGVSLSGDIAIIGIAGRFPGANSVEELWSLLVEGREGIATFSTNELEGEYATLSEADRARYVPRRGIVDGADMFDAKFFRLSEAEADLLDPQHRLLLEVAWEALETSCMAGNTGASLGVFTATSVSQYLLQNLLADPSVIAQHGPLQLLLFNDKDFLATRLSYLLDLHGPAVTLQTGCSSSLVALHYATLSLMRGDCDAALVGGVALALPQKSGYVYAENMISSKDGSCRAFDSESSGTVRGNGACAVVLKPIERALQDGDPIWGVIKATAINNDGREKVGFTAPSARWQSQVISTAIERSGVPVEHIDLVEAHGTGTALGDPIEAKALREAFTRVGATPGRERHLGALKTNIGHLDAAAGLAGLIKVCLSLKNELIPPTVHFRQLNPHIDFGPTPFTINTTPVPWKRKERPRCAGLSSFGIGGTNVHVIVQEAPASAPLAASTGPQVVVLSARSAKSFEGIQAAYQRHLEGMDETGLPHFAYSTRVGRKAFELRAAVVASSPQQAASELARCVARTCNKTYKTVGLELVDGSGLLPHLAELGAGAPAEQQLSRWLEGLGVTAGSATAMGARLRIAAGRIEVLAEKKVEAEVPLTASRAELESRLLAALWSLGVVVDWSRSSAGRGYRKVALPTYVFDRRRHWIAPTKREAAEATPRSVALPTSIAEVETLVLGGWRALLGGDALSPRDNVFDRGANSLLVGQFIEQVRSRTNITMSVTDCYEEPTAAGLAALIGRRLGLGASKPLEAAPAVAAPKPPEPSQPAAEAPRKTEAPSATAAPDGDAEVFQDL